MFKKSKRTNISKIVEDNLNHLIRFAYYRIGNHSEAEDLVYDAVFRFLKRLLKTSSRKAVSIN